MSFENLLNNTRLEIPDVHLPILASTYDHTANNRADARWNAVRPIRVAAISLDAARRLVIPKSNGRVLRGD